MSIFFVLSQWVIQIKFENYIFITKIFEIEMQLNAEKQVSS